MKLNYVQTYFLFLFVELGWYPPRRKSLDPYHLQDKLSGAQGAYLGSQQEY